MAQLLPRPLSLSEQLAQGLGEGTDIASQLYLQNLLQAQQAAQSKQGLAALGYSPQEAEQIAQLHPGLQQIALKEKFRTAQMAPLISQLQSLYGLGQPALPQMPEQAAMMPEALPQQAIAPEAVPTTQPSAQLSQAEAAQLMGAIATGDPRQLQQTIRDISKNRQRQEQFAKRMAFEERKEGLREKQEAFKLTKPERKEIIERAKNSRETLHDLERMEALEKEGKLDTPGYMEFLKRAGFDIPALMSPGSEEFQKLQASFLRDAKSYFGARVTNFELDQFLKAIPTLSQSPEGRKRVIANLKRVNRMALLHNEAMKDIIVKNKGIPPLDLMEQIDDEVGKKADKISKQFKEDLKKPVPEGQNRLITAMQAVLGSMVGGLGPMGVNQMNLLTKALPALIEAA